MRATTSALHRAVVTAPRRHGFVDLTDELCAAIDRAQLRDGVVIAFTMHTTCSLAINEWEDGIQEDLSALLERLAPCDAYYAHDDLSRRTQNLTEDERVNGHAHVSQLVVGGTSQLVPVIDGAPALGTWQRLVLIELDEPKPRVVLFAAIAL